MRWIFPLPSQDSSARECYVCESICDFSLFFFFYVFLMCHIHLVSAVERLTALHDTTTESHTGSVL